MTTILSWLEKLGLIGKLLFLAIVTCLIVAYALVRGNQEGLTV